MNALEITQDLIAFNSVTPAKDDVFMYVKSLLEENGFICQMLTFGEGEQRTPNLYASFGNTGKNLCFAGHLDVVPTGDLKSWQSDPFTPTIVDGSIYGRGASDMKAAVAAFIDAAIRATKSPDFHNTISLLLTGDEEASGKYGTKMALEALSKQGISLDYCLVGEPTCENFLGDTVKIGRRGSITFELTVKGIQGHVAYPHLAKNPIDMMVKILNEYINLSLDTGDANFSASNLEIVSVDVGNKANNVIPESVVARFNIRYNPTQNEASIKKMLHEIAQKFCDNYELKMLGNSHSFLTSDLSFAEFVAQIAKEHTGQETKLSTSGGTSDARFIKDYAIVAEFGLINATAHKTNENVLVEDIIKLSDIYYDIIMHFGN